jgi:hypothetical protein
MDPSERPRFQGVRLVRRIAAALLLAASTGLFAIPHTAFAYGPSCTTFTVSATSAGCTYQATGPGEFEAVTGAGWRILIQRNNGPWVQVARSNISGCLPPLNAIASGQIPAQAGDLVRLEIMSGCLQVAGMPNPAPRYQFGYISGGNAA